MTQSRFSRADSPRSSRKTATPKKASVLERPAPSEEPTPPPVTCSTKNWAGEAIALFTSASVPFPGVFGYFLALQNCASHPSLLLSNQ